jgi:hypothetical protein
MAIATYPLEETSAVDQDSGDRRPTDQSITVIGDGHLESEQSTVYVLEPGSRPNRLPHHHRA